MNRARGSLATIPANGGLMAIIPRSVPVKSHGRFSAPPGNPHLVADRANHVIGSENAKNVEPRPRERSHLLGPRVDEPAEETEGDAGAGSGAASQIHGL
jgi:hypothetical protein